MAVSFTVPVIAHAATNLPMSEIGDYGTWATDGNMELFTSEVKRDIDAFQSQSTQKTLVPDYVPIEAKIGIALMNGLSLVGDVLDGSLVRFVIIFLIVAYIFWIMFEAYNMMKNGSSAMELGVNLVKKGAYWQYGLLSWHSGQRARLCGLWHLYWGWRHTCLI